MENNLKKMFDQEQERKELHEAAAALVLSSYIMGKSFIPWDSEFKADDFLEQLNHSMEKQKRGMMNADVRLLFYKKAILLHFLMFKSSNPTASKLDFEIEISNVYDDFNSLLTGSNMLGREGRGGLPPSDEHAIMDYYFTKFGNPIYNNEDRQRSDTPFLNIGGKLYVYNGYSGSSQTSYDLVGELQTIKCTDGTKYTTQATESLDDLLIDNNYTYSFVNLDIPKKLKTDVLRFIEANPSIYYAYRRGANQMLSCMFHRFTLDRKLDDMLDHGRRGEKKVKITKAMEDDWADLVSRVKECVEITKKRIKQKYERDNARGSISATQPERAGGEDEHIHRPAQEPAELLS